VQVPALELPAISVEHTANPPLEVLDIVDRDAPGCDAVLSTRSMAGKSGHIFRALGRQAWYAD
jgi:hypothetical protein